MDWVWSWISVDSATASSRGLGQDGAAAGQRPDMGSGQTSRRGLLTPVLLATAVVGAWGVRESFATSNTPEGRGRLVGSELPVGDDGVHDQHCSLDRTHCEFFPVLPTDNCEARMMAGPKKGRNGGYGDTFPRPENVPSYTATHTQHARQTARWQHSAKLGALFLESVAASLATHPPRRAHRSTSAKQIRHALKLKSDCSTVPSDELRDAAEELVDTTVESRLWACALVLSGHGLPLETDEFSELIGEEQLWQSVEYRLMIREWARYELKMSNALCQRNFGSPSTKYLGAGVWGIAYRRCLAEAGCSVLPKVIVKLAGLPTETKWKDMKTKEELVLSSRVIASGIDPSPEAYMDEAVRLLVTHGVTPHLLLGYGSWICDDFLNVPRGRLPVTGLGLNDCHRKTDVKIDGKEKGAVCYNILDNVREGYMSPNLPVMTKEEVVLSVEEAIKGMHKKLSVHPSAFTDAVRALFFEVVYTVAALQKHFPKFRHNDLHWWNVRTTAPYHTNHTQPSSDVFAPLDDTTGKALTYTEYNASGRIFRVPNYGYSVRIGDWDGAHSLTIPRLRNRKVLQTRKRDCGREIPPRWLWASPLKIELIKVASRDTAPNEDSSSVPVKGLRSCNQWGTDGCENGVLALEELTALEESAVLQKCPLSCKTVGGVIRVFLQHAAFTKATKRGNDDPEYRDRDGNACGDWRGQCDRAKCFGFSDSEESSLFEKCPQSCGLWEGNAMHKHLGGQSNIYLIRLSGATGIPDGLYTASAQSSPDAEVVALEISVRGRAGIDLTSMGRDGTVEIFRRTWHTAFTLATAGGVNEEQRQEYKLIFGSPEYSEFGDIQSNDVLHIAGNEIGHTGNYRVQKVKRTSEGVEIRVVSETMRDRHAGHHETAANGIVYRVGRLCSAEMYRQSTSGITPVENDKFDLHFFFNRVQERMGSDSWANIFPERIVADIRRLFSDVDPDTLGWYAPFAHNYKISDDVDHYHWWCDRKGEWNTSDPHIKNLKTPAELLEGFLFTDFLVNAKSDHPRPPLARYSLTAPLPDKYCVGTGELRAKD